MARGAPAPPLWRQRLAGPRVGCCRTTRRSRGRAGRAARQDPARACIVSNRHIDKLGQKVRRALAEAIRDVVVLCRCRKAGALGGRRQLDGRVAERLGRQPAEDRPGIVFCGGGQNAVLCHNRISADETTHVQRALQYRKGARPDSPCRGPGTPTHPPATATGATAAGCKQGDSMHVQYKVHLIVPVGVRGLPWCRQRWRGCDRG